jgi:hypothetical protein
LIAELRKTAENCGSCGVEIPPLVPVYLVSTRRLLRCETCAKRIREDLPSPESASSVLPFRTPEVLPFTSSAALVRGPLDDLIAKVADSVPMDVRQRQTGERD